MLPVVARTTEDMLPLVPNALRESALALGAPRWRVTLGVVFRAAQAGLLTGVLLAVARVSGETAPLLFTALNSPLLARARSTAADGEPDRHHLQLRDVAVRGLAASSPGARRCSSPSACSALTVLARLRLQGGEGTGSDASRAVAPVSEVASGPAAAPRDRAGARPEVGRTARPTKISVQGP